MSSTIYPLVGQRFGRLTVVSGPISDGSGHRKWFCVCDCRGTALIATKRLRNGHTRSCGCLVQDTARENGRHSKGAPRHGMSRTSTHNIWKSMISRATGKESVNVRERYQHIAVCDRWRVFENFLADMGVRPAGLTLERVDNSRGYEPSNCKWATYTEQSRNRRPRRPRVEVRAAREMVAQRRAS
jgi:hypothetical protein